MFTNQLIWFRGTIGLAIVLSSVLGQRFVQGAPGDLPPGWTSEDVGAVSAPGSSSFDGTTFTIRGSGTDIWNPSDEFQFAHQPVTGDFEFFARVASIENVNLWTKAGLMLRQGVGAKAPHAFVLATPTTEKGIAFQRRIVTSGVTLSTAGPALTGPIWLRLVRHGNIVTSAYTTGPTSPWIAVGSQTYTNLPATLEVGLAVTSHLDGTLATATFDTVMLRPVTAGLPPGWASRDIGAVSAAGSTTFDGTRWTVHGSGADIWGTADEFHYAATSMTARTENFFEITARVVSVENVNQWTKAGIMLRSSDAASAAHASLFVTPTAAKGVVFQQRRSHGATSVSTPVAAIAAPVWLKLQVAPGGVRAYFRTGVTQPWTLIDTGETGVGGETIEVGLAVSSHVDGRPARATFDNVSVRSHFSWGDGDIGSVGVPGATHSNGAVFTLEGSGADIWGTGDAFRFLWTDASVGISARVLSVENTHPWAKAGVMLRDSSDSSNLRNPGGPHVMLVVTPGKGVAMQYRSAAGGISTQRVAIAGTAPRWVRLKRVGSTVSGEVSNDGVAWTPVGTVSVTFSSEFPVSGLVVTSHDNATLATASFDDVVLYTVVAGHEVALLPVELP